MARPTSTAPVAEPDSPEESSPKPAPTPLRQSRPLLSLLALPQCAISPASSGESKTIAIPDRIIVRLATTPS